MSNAAVLFEPDGYVLDGPKLMGRQSAGNGFLRATVASQGPETLWGYTPSKRSAEIFETVVADLDPAVKAAWLPASRLDLLAKVGTLYLPGPDLATHARLRLRLGPGAYSLVGVTHTIASHLAMDAITGLLTGPVMPWDALICTSRAVSESVRVMLAAEAEYLAWRLGAKAAPPIPELPTIPLGIHTADFAASPDEREAARTALGIAPDETVALFVGRLSFHAKAHPHAMYAGLERAARETGRKIVLLQCGWFANDFIEKAFRSGAATFAPSVRALFADGRADVSRRRAWAAGDVFVSLSDNIQETFGLAPVEAMAAGLPVVVTDWDGYKDTVRDGIDGFRIPTAMPAPAFGFRFALDYEAGTHTYDHYCGATCQTISVDFGKLVQALSTIVARPDLRRTMGEAGRRRAREQFDWGAVMKDYRALYTHLAGIRAEAAGRIGPAPRAAPARMSPFAAFANFSTALIEPQTAVRLLPGATVEAWDAMRVHPLFDYAQGALPERAVMDGVIRSLGERAETVDALAETLRVPVPTALIAVSVLAKMGLVAVARGEGG